LTLKLAQLHLQVGRVQLVSYGMDLVVHHFMNAMRIRRFFLHDVVRNIEASGAVTARVYDVAPAP
jgi:hypothetical protein